MTVNLVDIWDTEDWTFLPASIGCNVLKEAFIERTIASNTVNGADALTNRINQATETFNNYCSFLYDGSIFIRGNEFKRLLYGLKDAYLATDPYGTPVPGFGHLFKESSAFSGHTSPDDCYLLASADVRAALAYKEHIRALRWIRLFYFNITFASASHRFRLTDYQTSADFVYAIQQYFSNATNYTTYTINQSYYGSTWSVYTTTMCGAKIESTSYYDYECNITMLIPIAFEVSNRPMSSKPDLSGASLYIETTDLKQTYFWDCGQEWKHNDFNSWSIPEGNKCQFDWPPPMDDSEFVSALNFSIERKETVWCGFSFSDSGGFSRPYFYADLNPIFKYK